LHIARAGCQRLSKVADHLQTAFEFRPLGEIGDIARRRLDAKLSDQGAQPEAQRFDAIKLISMPNNQRAIFAKVGCLQIGSDS
jgi:hypothetical protein